MISYNAKYKSGNNHDFRNHPQKQFGSAKSFPSHTLIHPKLELTEPGDSDEQEADAAASDVMSGKVCRKISGGGAGGGMAVSSQMESQLNHLQGGGQSMPAGLRGMMERGFDRDFSQVRLHTDSEAAGLSSSINAKAFTHGNDIYFNRGQFSPETSEGQRLVAHELAHVAQGGGKVGRDEEDEHKYIIHNGFKDCEGESCKSEKNYLEGLLDDSVCIEERYLRTCFGANNSCSLNKYYRMLLNHLDIVKYKKMIKNTSSANASFQNQSLLYDPRNRDFHVQQEQPSKFIYIRSQNPNPQVQLNQGPDFYPEKIDYNVHLIIGHGSSGSIRYNGERITDPERLRDILISEGRDIKPHEIVVFTSCEIGEGENSFAQRFSALLKENIVVASNVTVSSSNVKISSLDSDGVPVRNNEGKPKVDGYVMDFCSNDEGFFNVFRNGERIDNRTIFGDKNPPKCIYGSNSLKLQS